jgi:hypothetical protein
MIAARTVPGRVPAREAYDAMLREANARRAAEPLFLQP